MPTPVLTHSRMASQPTVAAYFRTSLTQPPENSSLNMHFIPSFVFILVNLLQRQSRAAIFLVNDRPSFLGCPGFRSTLANNISHATPDPFSVWQTVFPGEPLDERIRRAWDPKFEATRRLRGMRSARRPTVRCRSLVRAETQIALCKAPLTR